MVDTKEIWKDVTINTNYEVSNLGRVRAKARNVPTKNGGFRKKKEHYLTQTNYHGYLHVGFLVKGKLVSPLVHRLVMHAFVGEKPYPEWEIDHINGNSLDNRLENLEYVSSSENTKRSYSLGLQDKSKLSMANHNRIATPEEIVYIKEQFIKEGRTLPSRKNKDFYERMAAKFNYKNPKSIYSIIKGNTNSFFGEDIVQTTKINRIKINYNDLDFSKCKSTKDKHKIIAEALKRPLSTIECRYYKYKESLEEIVEYFNSK